MTVIARKKLEFSKEGYRQPIVLGLFLVLFFWIQFAEGQKRNDSPVAGGNSDAQRASKASMSGKSVMFDQTKLRPGDVSSFETFRRSIVNSALSYDLPPDLSGGEEKAAGKKSDEEKELSFPSFPRVWTERSMEDYSGISAYASATIPIPFVTGTTYGLRLNKNYRYSVKTTFVLVASDSSDHSKNQTRPRCDRQIAKMKIKF
ncbi:MAG: hypothetical protein IPJ71_06255 [Bdellovibrionales bacterium]|nr:hypothetical protein [Bdellovibrionales bacterium]